MSSDDDYDIRPEYKREDFPGGFVTGKYAKRYHQSSNVVVLDPEVAEVFPNAEAVNSALRRLIQLGGLAQGPEAG